MPEQSPAAETLSNSVPSTWARFLAGADETLSELLASNRGDHLSRYRIREIVPIRGNVPKLERGWSAVRIETSTPIVLSEELSSRDGSSVMQFYGVTQHLHYTSDAQRQKLDKHSIPEIEHLDHITAVLIPIGKSEEWWKLAQDQRQQYFTKTDAYEGHASIGQKYVDRIFRKLYHSRYLNDKLGYDFLTYFEFKDIYEKDFKALLAELRDTKNNPEWAFVNHEYEIWMTRIG